MYISRQKDVAEAVKYVKEYGSMNIDLNVNIRPGETLEIPDIHWVESLIVQGEGDVVFPDLVTVHGEIRLMQHGLADFPVLTEVGAEFTVITRGRTTSERKREFDCLSIKNSEMPPMFHAPNLKHCQGSPWDRTDIDIWIPIANDREYTLQYNPGSGQVTAGCRNFDEVDEAIAHWKDRATETAQVKRTQHDGNYYADDDRPAHNRAIMFVFALTNLKEAIRNKELFSF